MARKSSSESTGATGSEEVQCSALGVGVLSGGYGQEELERAGAYRVYQDPADLLRHLDEVGIRGE